MESGVARAAHRHRGLPRAAVPHDLADAPRAVAHHRGGQGRPAAHRLPGGRQRQHPARRAPRARGGHRATRSCSARRRASASTPSSSASTSTARCSIDPRESRRLDDYVDAYWQKRQRQRHDARHRACKELRRSRTAFGLMMVDAGRRRRAGRGRAPGLPGDDPPGAADHRRARAASSAPPACTWWSPRRACASWPTPPSTSSPTRRRSPRSRCSAADAVRELGHRAARRHAQLLELRRRAAPRSRSKVADATAHRASACGPDLMIDGEMQANVALDEEARAPYPF